MTAMIRSPLAYALCAAFGLGATVSCYTVDFDENQADVFYCQSNDDCGSSQACWQFRCVDDTGPVATLTNPEKLNPFQNGEASLSVNYSFENFTVSDSASVVEGQGRVLVSVDGTSIEQFVESPDGVNLDISSLAPGAHRVKIQAVRGDNTPYTNPSATAHQVFYIMDENPDRPQVAIVFPYPGYKHIVGEPLEVIVAARNFEFLEAGEDCIVDDGCDPWAIDVMNPDVPPECLPDTCELVNAGHPHVYVQDDYPGCLDNEVSCSGSYLDSLRPAPEGAVVNGQVLSKVVLGDRFQEAGELTFSVGLQYNAHEPFPNKDFIVFDQITITVGER